MPLKINLLLKQQNVKQIENQFEIKCESFSLTTFEEIEDPENLTKEKNNLRLTLRKWQIDENSFHLRNKSIWEEYELFRKNLQCIYHYFVCVKLTAKAAKELANMIINLGGLERNTEAFEEIDNDTMEQSILELIQDNEIRASWIELGACKKDYDIATKNFKILLEIIDFSWEDLNKLKQQYDDVFLKYQHARSQVENELPVSLEKMKEIFYNCLHLLGGNIQEFMICTINLDGLVKTMADRFTGNNKREERN
ncbi:hypothetical protein BDFB_011341 [Asbolus verrucosus]|uniref:Uncharacterized protein n=1 Tax=Asbolus verrucosus TaxID=1661398 RepID=A0A482VXG2_ASBVE|nr:hypothetical protein BDFB_011341 [Asbolus verrucosus]